MKYEWKKHAKDLYLPARTPQLVNVPKLPFFMIKGEGDPNKDAFLEKVGVLYSLAYAVKMLPKKGITPAGYYDYTVFPLEGIWDLSEEGRQAKQWDKSQLVYTIMIRQPDYLNQALADEVLQMVSNKSPNPLLNQIEFSYVEDGLCVQMLHLGSYDNEPESFKLMNEFCNENSLKKKTYTHREIYLSDARKVAPEKLKTVLRYQISKESK
ncbi:hypothetical protein E0485_09245 [Paenibacillus albiflavus]|uniref:GyrI-like small molecule binding domain-containing protein n=1 Tax=Paenibacillus albiflavus TaxID=2545760 RepID=A0A4R4EIW0_9BACL|nr:GyrI-like domain-containing protein [Paenibacillus albiflavus]TCZ78291.1 hypothetical protein E0485_09245 [Paenibacillus albiflavus]